ncbi:PLD nuclease N-terminal domain-containing protein [Microbacterium sp.]|uniref:PLD nuclease N-terminal domain-containing protein n=1 Tax=Microbacterium sp. TaxID=51671 RepID=UPI003C7618EB
MVRILLPLALLLIAFWVYSIVDCALQPPTRHRGVSKPVWLLIVVLIPVLGGILWFVVGRGRDRPQPQFRAPDDNPDFLGSIGSITDQDERIRRLEAELAALDAEDSSPDAAPGDHRSEHRKDHRDDTRGDADPRGSVG